MAKVYDLVGGHFADGGRDSRRGLDCWGLVMEVFKRYGITLPDFNVGAFSFSVINALAELEPKNGQWEKVSYPNDEDAPLVVLMRMHPNLITHAGVWLGSNRIIHTMKSTNVIISRAAALKSRIVGYYRLCSE